MKALLFIFLLSPTISFAQFFEGTITYSNTYKSKTAQTNDDELNSMMGTAQKYYIKGGDYKSIFNGTFVKMQLYKNNENRSYTLTCKSDSLYWEDYGKNKDIATKFEFKKNQETILGILCDVFIISTPKSKTYFYFNKKYRINYNLYTKHQYGNWYYIISKTEALPLKTIYEDDQIVLSSTAITITSQQLNDSIFEIPDKNKIKPATW